jgi:ParB family chromosome partitioning protein
MALIENVQRCDLSPFEEADGYRRLLEEFEYTQEQLAKSVGKSRSHIANLIRLLTLPLSVRTLVEDGKLTAGQVRPLIHNPEAETLAQQVLDQGLSARQAEQLALGALKAASPPSPAVPVVADLGAEGIGADDDLLDGVNTGPRPDLASAPTQPDLSAEAIAHARLVAKIKDPNVAELEEKLTDALGLRVEVAGTGDKGQLRIVYTSMQQLGHVVRLLSSSLEDKGAPDFLTERPFGG